MILKAFQVCCSFSLWCSSLVNQVYVNCYTIILNPNQIDSCSPQFVFLKLIQIIM